MGGNSTSNRCCEFFFQEEGLWLSVPVVKLGSGRMMSKYSKVVIRMRMGLFLHIRPTIQNLRISRWEFQSRRHISWVFLEAGGFSGVGSPKYSTYPQITGIWIVSVLFGCQQLDQYPPSTISTSEKNTTAARFSYCGWASEILHHLGW